MMTDLNIDGYFAQCLISVWWCKEMVSYATFMVIIDDYKMYLCNRVYVLDMVWLGHQWRPQIRES